MKTLLSILMLATSLNAFAGEPGWKSKASPWLIKQYERQGKVQSNPTVLIYMKEEANLTAVNQSASRVDRIGSVFRSLVDTAESPKHKLPCIFEGLANLADT